MFNRTVKSQVVVEKEISVVSEQLDITSDSIASSELEDSIVEQSSLQLVDEETLNKMSLEKMPMKIIKLDKLKSSLQEVTEVDASSDTSLSISLESLKRIDL